jgi:hypothetical protein
MLLRQLLRPHPHSHSMLFIHPPELLRMLLLHIFEL